MKKILLLALIFTCSKAYANNYHIEFLIVAKNNHNQEIPQKSTDENNKLLVSVQGTSIQNYTNEEGVAQLEFSKDHRPGTPIKLNVHKKNWKIVDPINGFLNIPSRLATEPYRIVLTQEQKQSPLGNLSNEAPTPPSTYTEHTKLRYAVQVFVTRDQNKAREIVKSLRRQGFDAHSDRTYRTKDGDGFETKIFVGKYLLREEAEPVLKKLERRAGLKKPFIQDIYLDK